MSWISCHVGSSHSAVISFPGFEILPVPAPGVAVSFQKELLYLQLWAGECARFLLAKKSLYEATVYGSLTNCACLFSFFLLCCQRYSARQSLHSCSCCLLVRSLIPSLSAGELVLNSLLSTSEATDLPFPPVLLLQCLGLLFLHGAEQRLYSVVVNESIFLWSGSAAVTDAKMFHTLTCSGFAWALWCFCRLSCIDTSLWVPLWLVLIALALS